MPSNLATGTATAVGTTINVEWSEVANAVGYTVEYQVYDEEIPSDAWTILPTVTGTQTSFVGVEGTVYKVRVKALGPEHYADSEYTDLDGTITPDVQIAGLELTPSGALAEDCVLTATLDPSAATTDAKASYVWSVDGVAVHDEGNLGHQYSLICAAAARQNSRSRTFRTIIWASPAMGNLASHPSGTWHDMTLVAVRPGQPCTWPSTALAKLAKNSSASFLAAPLIRRWPSWASLPPIWASTL